MKIRVYCQQCAMLLNQDSEQDPVGKGVSAQRKILLEERDAKAATVQNPIIYRPQSIFDASQSRDYSLIQHIETIRTEEAYFKTE